MTFRTSTILIRTAASTAAASAITTAALVTTHAVPIAYAADVILLAALSFGTWRRSRICAAVSVIYWLSSKMFQMVETPHVFNDLGRGIALAALAAFIGGLVGTVVYHRRTAQTLSGAV